MLQQFDALLVRLSQSLGVELHEVSEMRRNAQGQVVITKAQRLSHHRLTSQSPQASRIGRWKSEMTSAEQVRYENVAGPLLAELGYETIASSKAA